LEFFSNTQHFFSFFHSDPLGEGWIFPSIVNEYIRDVDTAFHINSSTNNSEKKGVMNGGDEKRNGKQQLQLPEHDFEW
jgi:hypothetical protein